MNPIEAACRKLARRHGRDPDEPVLAAEFQRMVRGDPRPVTSSDTRLWEEFVPQVRAVIEGIREIDDPLSPVLDAGKCSRGHWRSMIDQLLAGSVT